MGIEMAVTHEMKSQNFRFALNTTTTQKSNSVDTDEMHELFAKISKCHESYKVIKNGLSGGQPDRSLNLVSEDFTDFLVERGIMKIM